MIPRILRLLVVAAAVVMTPVVLVAQDISCGKTGDIEVRHLSFEGNHAFTTSLLSAGINTEQSSTMRRVFRVFGKRHCLDKLEFSRDSLRLILFYQKAGYNSVHVTTTTKALHPGIVAITIAIAEGEPTRISTLEITGLDSVPGGAAIKRGLPIHQGDPLDLGRIAAAEDTLRRRLRETGYPTADVFRAYNTDSAGTSLNLDVDPGTRAHIGAIDLSVKPRENHAQEVSDGTIRRLIGVKPGDLYREGPLERGKRNLIATESFVAVVVELDSNDVKPPGDSLVTVHVNLTEGLTHSVRPGVGWGTLDCFRASGEYRDYNFSPRVTRFESTVRLSKIGIGRPLTGASAFCSPSVRGDPFSTRLNYYLGTTFSDARPLLFGMRPSVTFYTENRSEFNAYLRTTPIGFVLSGQRQSHDTRRVQTVSYQMEYGRTDAQPAIFCALQNLCLAEDREPLLVNRRLAVLGWSLTQDWSDNAQYPTSGSVGKLEVRHASAPIGSDSRVQFSKGTADFAMYFNIGKGWVLTPRVRVGEVVGPSFTGTSKFIPAQERLFAGGGNTVRGFRENDLGPKVYITGGYDTVRAGGGTSTAAIAPTDTVYFRAHPGVTAQRSVPTGGSALAVANIELRVPSPLFADFLRYSFFVDAGELWSPGAVEAQDQFQHLKVTPGLGIRIGTPVGAIRVDIAYNAYAPRPGAAFFDTPAAVGGQLYCVSPGNSLPVTGLGGANGAPPVQAAGTCARDFRPPAVQGFFKRLVLTFGLGQAY